MDHYESEIITAQDYYPYGMEMLGEDELSSLTPISGRVYQNPFFFNDNRMKSIGLVCRWQANEVASTHLSRTWGEGRDFHEDVTNYDYGFRIYNPGIARFLSVDPLTKEYPMLTPYQFASNTPIRAIDLDGLEAVVITGSLGVDAQDKLFQFASHTEEVFQETDVFEGNEVVYKFTNIDGGYQEFIFEGALVEAPRSRSMNEVMNDNVVVQTVQKAGKAFADNHPSGERIISGVGDGGDIVTGVGVITTPFNPPLGLALVGVGNSLSASGTLLEASVDAVGDGEYGKAFKDILIEGVGAAAGGSASTVLKRSNLDKGTPEGAVKTVDVIISQIEGVVSAVKRALRGNDNASSQEELKQAPKGP